MNVAHLLIGQAGKHPNNLAIVEAGRSITFGELARHSARCAAMLAKAGIGPGDSVLVFVPMSIDLYLALIGIMRVGAVAMFLDPSVGAEHINQCCRRIAPKGMIAIAKAHLLRLGCKSLRQIPQKFSVGFPVFGATNWRRAGMMQPLEKIEPRQLDDPALITFTSGSTGQPKAAVRSHGFLAAQHATLQRTIKLEAGEIDLSTLPIFTLANIASGVTSVIPNVDLKSPGKIDPVPVLRQIDQLKIGRCAASPAFFQRLLHGPDVAKAMSRFNQIYTGGAPVFPSLLKQLQETMPGARIVAVYGSTEAEPIAEIAWSDMTEADVQAMHGGAGLLTGLPVPEIRLRIIPNRSGQSLSPVTGAELDRQTLSHGEPGEIIVQGDHVLRGYLQGVGDSETKWAVDGQIWHRTGDAGYLDRQGRLWLLGRASEQIVDERGTIHPFAVECAAGQVNGIERSALVRHQGRRVLVVQLSKGQSAAPAVEQLKQSLKWAKLDEIRPVARIRLDKRHNAKIDYPALRKILQ